MHSLNDIHVYERLATSFGDHVIIMFNLCFKYLIRKSKNQFQVACSFRRNFEGQLNFSFKSIPIWCSQIIHRALSRKHIEWPWLLRSNMSMPFFKNPFGIIKSCELYVGIAWTHKTKTDGIGRVSIQCNACINHHANQMFRKKLLITPFLYLRWKKPLS